MTQSLREFCYYQQLCICLEKDIAYDTFTEMHRVPRPFQKSTAEERSCPIFSDHARQGQENSDLPNRTKILA